MALLEVNDLRKSFNKKKKKITAVDDICFSIDHGECLGLVGESGCGKSTAANILARLLKEDAGTIIFNGLKINDSRYLKPVGKQLQMVFQNPRDSFDPRDTVIQAVMQGARSYRLWDRKTLCMRALEKLEYVGLKTSYADAKVSKLSGGECQRVAIARAILCEPELIICDEATSSLDVLVQAQMIALFKKLKNEKNMALLFITHDLPLAAALCDRIAVMQAGKIVETGEALQILHNPAASYTKLLLDSVLSVPVNRPGY